jgi:hypothetical protein
MKMGAFALLASAVGLVAIIALAVFLLWRPDPLSQARGSGDPGRVVRVPATIESVRDTGSRHNQNPIVAFGLGFATPDGRRFSVSVERAVPMLQLSQVAVGKLVMLEYDAADPNKAELTDPLEFGVR